MNTEEVEPGSRQQRKERTRQAILDSALALCATEPLAAVSLRTIAKEVGIVPTAFYRHFASIDDLGLALSDQGAGAIRDLIARTSARARAATDPIVEAVDALLTTAGPDSELIGFVTRERWCGTEVVRDRINHELDLITRELATDLARIPQAQRWPTDDLLVVADLCLSLGLGTVQLIVTGHPAPAQRQRLEKQIRMLLVGTRNWHSS
ncbi:MAG TPA: TetR family transcriptional regulator [Marmoricola sp.]|nr:TetR family transcriptional regulator [Marmoricola sp.]HNI71402.1 TetR family transcriptional regulator [Marmoricola sp.]HNN48999.1 TetR family transcriptional regulator [Marmoricola sp.]HNO39907.1 TetR family transcriptional regulator [Marmoricola sp.]